jgi:hypothetical protein
MPKEFTHWVVAAEAMGLAAERGVFSPASPRERAAVLFGAVAPDLLFYYLAGSAAGEFRRASRALHGDGGADSLAPLRRRPDDPRADRVWSEPFAFGWLSHVAADVSFHPLVWYSAGPALADHFAFESTLDLHFMARGEGRSDRERLPIRLRELKAALAEAWPDFAVFVDGFIFSGAPHERGEFGRCLSRALAIQALFHSPAAGLAAGLLSRLVPGLRPFVSAFYSPRFRRLAAAFRGRLDYRHPVSGEESSATVDELVGRAARKTLELWEARAKRSLPAPGPSLDSGLPADHDQTRRFALAGGLEKFFERRS